MSRAFLSVVLATAFCSLGARSPRVALLDSIAPLSWSEPDFVTGKPESGNRCTVWSLNEAKGYWVTALHCVQDDDGVLAPNKDYHIYAHVAAPIASDETNDIALLLSSATAPALPLTSVPATWDDEVSSAGYPLGFSEPLLFRGRMIGFEEFANFEGRRFLTFSLAGGPGNSGSPILNVDGQVISLWQIGITPFGAFAGGVQTGLLYDFLAPYAAQ